MDVMLCLVPTIRLRSTTWLRLSLRYVNTSGNYHILPIMNLSDSFTVIVRGVESVLTRSQVEFDSPNFFTTCFLGNFQESQTRTLKVSRDPVLFGIICDYLCGYVVLPLNKEVIPKRMCLAAALANLRIDADFYQLDGLVQVCDTSTIPASKSKDNCVAIAGSRSDIRYAGTYLGF